MSEILAVHDAQGEPAMGARELLPMKHIAISHWKVQQLIRRELARRARVGTIATIQGVMLTSPVIRRLAREYRERLEAERDSA